MKALPAGSYSDARKALPSDSSASIKALPALLRLYLRADIKALLRLYLRAAPPLSRLYVLY
jgi:hypothetical protein